MRTELRLLAVVLLAGCVLDEAWSDDVTLVAQQAGVSGVVYTIETMEGNSVGIGLCANEIVRNVHASFVGPGEITFVMQTESEGERGRVFVDFFCDEDRDGNADRSADEEDIGVESFPFGPREERLIELAPDIHPSCPGNSN